MEDLEREGGKDSHSQLFYSHGGIRVAVDLLDEIFKEVSRSDDNGGLRICILQRLGRRNRGNSLTRNPS